MVAVALSRRRQQEFIRVAQCLGENRHRPRVNAAAMPPVQHLMQVAQEAESRHIRTGVYVVFSAAIGGILIQGSHGLHGILHGLPAGLPHPIGRAQNAHTQPLGQHQLIALLGRIVGVNVVRVDNSHDRQAVLHIRVRDGVAPSQHAPGLGHLFRAAAHDLPQNVQIRLLREAHDVQRRFHLAAHGPYIAECVGGGDFPAGVGIVHHRWEKVQCLHHRHILCQLIHGSVVLAVVADEQILVRRKLRQTLQHPTQYPGAQLGGTAAPLAE